MSPRFNVQLETDPEVYTDEGLSWSGEAEDAGHAADLALEAHPEARVYDVEEEEA